MLTRRSIPAVTPAHAQRPGAASQAPAAGGACGQAVGRVGRDCGVRCSSNGASEAGTAAGRGVSASRGGGGGGACELWGAARSPMLVVAGHACRCTWSRGPAIRSSPPTAAHHLPARFHPLRVFAARPAHRWLGGRCTQFDPHAVRCFAIREHAELRRRCSRAVAVGLVGGDGGGVDARPPSQPLHPPATCRTRARAGW